MFKTRVLYYIKEWLPYSNIAKYSSREAGSIEVDKYPCKWDEKILKCISNDTLNNKIEVFGYEIDKK